MDKTCPTMEQLGYEPAGATDQPPTRARRRSFNGGSGPASNHDTKREPAGQRARRQSFNGASLADDLATFNMIEDSSKEEPKNDEPKTSSRPGRRRSFNGASLGDLSKLELDSSSDEPTAQKSDESKSNSSSRPARRRSFNGASMGPKLATLELSDDSPGEQSAASKSEDVKCNSSSRPGRRRSFNGASMGDLAKLEVSDESPKDVPSVQKSTGTKSRRRSFNSASLGDNLAQLVDLDDNTPADDQSVFSKSEESKGNSASRPARRRSFNNVAKLELNEDSSGEPAVPKRRESGAVSSGKARRRSFNGGAASSLASSLDKLALESDAESGEEGVFSVPLDDKCLPPSRRPRRRKSMSQNDTESGYSSSGSTASAASEGGGARIARRRSRSQSRRPSGYTSADSCGSDGGEMRVTRRRGRSQSRMQSDGEDEASVAGEKRTARRRSRSANRAGSSTNESDSPDNNGEKTVARRRTVDLRRPLPPRTTGSAPASRENSVDPSARISEETQSTPNDNTNENGNPTPALEEESTELSKKESVANESIVDTSCEPKKEKENVTTESTTESTVGASSDENENSRSQRKTKRKSGVCFASTPADDVKVKSKVCFEAHTKETSKVSFGVGTKESSRVSFMSDEGKKVTSSSVPSSDPFCAMEAFFSSVSTKLEEEPYKKHGFSGDGRRFFVNKEAMPPKSRYETPEGEDTDDSESEDSEGNDKITRALALKAVGGKSVARNFRDAFKTQASSWLSVKKVR